MAHEEIDRLCVRSALYRRSPDAPFAGGSTHRGVFDLRPNDGQSSLVPLVVRVVVEPGHAGGARVRVTVALPRLLAASTPLLMAPVVIDALALGGQWLVALVPLTLLALAVATTSFRYEARAVEQMLRSAFAEAPGLPGPPETGGPYR